MQHSDRAETVQCPSNQVVEVEVKKTNVGNRNAVNEILKNIFQR